MPQLNSTDETYSTRPTIAQDVRTKEPEHDLPAEECPEEVGDLGRCLTGVVCEKLLANVVVCASEYH